MNLDLVVSESIEINTSTGKVWNGLTTPEIIKEYLFGTETITNWKVDSEIVFQGEYQGKSYRDRGVILENVPEEVLSYTYWSGFTGLEDKPENYSVVKYELEKVDGDKTKFTWTQKGFKDEESYNHSKNGMPDFLKNIKKVIEAIS